MIVPFLSQLVGNLEQLGGATGTRLVHSALDLGLDHVLQRTRSGERGERPHRTRRSCNGCARTSTPISRRPSSGPDADRGSPLHLDATPARAVPGGGNNGSRRGSVPAGSERCRRDLVNPALADRPVAAIASRWGFVDAAHFSRVFQGGIRSVSERVPRLPLIGILPGRARRLTIGARYSRAP